MDTTPVDLPAIDASAAPARRHFSDILLSLTQTGASRIYFSDLRTAFGDRAFGALLFVFGAPNMLPLPPGTSSVLGTPLIIVAAQLAMGRRVLWLPEWVSQRSLAMEDFKRFVDRLLPYLRKAERVLKPRLPFLFGVLGDRLTGVICLLLGVILFLPIMGGNLLPGVAVTAFALGLAERDGVAILFGWLMTIMSFAVMGVLLGAMLVAARAFFQALGVLG